MYFVYFVINVVQSQDGSGPGSSSGSGAESWSGATGSCVIPIILAQSIRSNAIRMTRKLALRKMYALTNVLVKNNFIGFYNL